MISPRAVGKAPPWSPDFPRVAIHTTVSKLRQHPDFDRAKQGDVDGAFRVVRDLVKFERLEEIGRSHPDAIAVCVHGEERTGRNKLPIVLVEALREFGGLGSAAEIVQINRVFHTDANAISRLLRPPRFEGRVKPDHPYIVVDDVSVSGSSLAGPVRARCIPAQSALV